MNVWVLIKGLELQSANGERFDINKRLFAMIKHQRLSRRRSCVDWRVSMVEYAKEES